MSEFRRGRTSFVVAHRLATVLAADQIVVLQDGRVTDVGKHAELIARCNLYQELCRTQFITADSVKQ